MADSFRVVEQSLTRLEYLKNNVPVWLSQFSSLKLVFMTVIWGGHAVVSAERACRGGFEGRKQLRGVFNVIGGFELGAMRLMLKREVIVR